MNAGIHTMSAAAYHADPAEWPSLTASIAHKLVTQTPKHAWTAHPRLNPEFEREEKPAFDLGTVFHALFLEGDDSKVAIVDASSWQTKSAKEARDEARAAGRTPLLAKDWERVRLMLNTVCEQIESRNDDPPLFSDGKPEETLVWAEGDVICRARLDWLRDDHAAIDDVKSTFTANPVSWGRRTLWGIGADVQVAFYLRGLKKLTGIDAQFRYMLAETQPPYAISVVSLEPSALELGNAKVDRAITKWRECLKSGVWPAYPASTYWAEAPAWVAEQFMELDAEALNA